MATEQELRAQLERLVESGHVERHPTEDKYRLTAEGIASVESDMASEYLRAFAELGKRPQGDPGALPHPIDGRRRRAP
jgi:predicted transcriptional regulator